jgi:integrase
MGQVYKRGKKWGISYIDPDGIQVRKIVAPFKETAEKILNKIETQIAENRYLDIRQEKRVLFEELAREYLNTHVGSENKNAGRQKSLIRNLESHFKGKHLHQINTLAIRQYLTKRIEIEKVKPATANREYAMIQSMFNRAIEWGMFLGTNPTKDIKKFTENNSRDRWLNEEEQAKLLSYCHGLTRVVVIIALKTGMRWGEIVHLKWRQSLNSNYIDFDNGVICIHEAATKTLRSRFIPLSNAVRLALRDVPKSTDHDYIFWNTKTEKPLGSVKDSFNRALKKAKIQNFQFRDLRHTFASHLVMKGVDLYVVQQLLGHTTPKMTQRYAHLSPRQFREAIEKIDIQSDNLLYNSKSTDEKFMEVDLFSTNLAQSPSEKNESESVDAVSINK